MSGRASGSSVAPWLSSSAASSGAVPVPAATGPADAAASASACLTSGSVSIRFSRIVVCVFERAAQLPAGLRVQQGQLLEVPLAVRLDLRPRVTRVWGNDGIPPLPAFALLLPQVLGHQLVF